ncbi:MAG: hypothetical protein K5871_05135 [Lachnospiraceae bacterium]|nr:hypothetical protein [Lachnospiraceae bacterium]
MKTIFGTAVFLVLTLQILTGLVWGCLNFPYLQEFGDTTGLLRMSEGLFLQGDTGVIYPALLAIVRTMFLNSPVRYYQVMYLLQLVLAFISWFYFSQQVLGIEKTRMRIWFSLAVITCPFAMQCHMAVLEYSFASSFLCLLVTFQIRFMREWKEDLSRIAASRVFRDTCIVSLFWLFLSLLRKEFVLLGFIPVLSVYITIVRRIKAVLMPAVTIICFATLIFTSVHIFGIGNGLSPVQNFRMSLYYRVAWNEDFQDLDHIPAHVREVTDEETLEDIIADPGLIYRIGDAARRTIGTEETVIEFPGWAWVAFRDNKTAIVIDTMTEIAGYTFAPLINHIKLAGVGLPGYSTGNYDVMRRICPVLTKFYLRVFSVVYVMILVAFVIAKIAELTGSAANRSSADAAETADAESGHAICSIGELIPVIAVIVTSSFIYAFSGNNVWDHRKALFATCMWMSLFAGSSVKEK